MRVNSLQETVDKHGENKGGTLLPFYRDENPMNLVKRSSLSVSLGRGVWSVSLKSFVDTHFRDEHLQHPRC